MGKVTEVRKEGTHELKSPGTGAGLQKYDMVCNNLFVVRYSTFNRYE